MSVCYRGLAAPGSVSARHEEAIRSLRLFPVVGRQASANATIQAMQFRRGCIVVTADQGDPARLWRTLVSDYGGLKGEPKGPVKITGYKTFLVDAHRANFIFVKLQTDSGYEGLGEATAEWNERAVVAAIEELGEFLDRQGSVRDRLPDPTMHRNSYWRTGVDLSQRVQRHGGGAA